MGLGAGSAAAADAGAAVDATAAGRLHWHACATRELDTMMADDAALPLAGGGRVAGHDVGRRSRLGARNSGVIIFQRQLVDRTRGCSQSLVAPRVYELQSATSSHAVGVRQELN